jgi:hypothetical protein
MKDLKHIKHFNEAQENLNSEPRELGISDVSGSFFTNDEVIKFFDDNLSIFRQCAKDAKTSEEQENYIRFCDATSYLKQMWIGKK